MNGMARIIVFRVIGLARRSIIVRTVLPRWLIMSSVIHGFEWTTPRQRQHTNSFINPSSDGTQRLVVTSADSRDGAQAGGRWVSMDREHLMEVQN